MDKEIIAALADKYHDQGFNCAQSVFAALSEMTGIDAETALKIGGGFGGGLRCGEVCGAVSGAVMAIGCMYPYNQPGDQTAKNKIAEKTIQFTDAFKNCYGCLRCAELKSDKRPCAELIRAAAVMAADLK